MQNKSLLVAMVLGSAVSALSSCTDPPVEMLPPAVDMMVQKPFHVMGVVVGNQDMPIADAAVRLGTSVASTGADGRFTIELHNPKLPLPFSISAPGYVPFVSQMTADSMDVKYRLQRVTELSFPSNLFPLTITDPSSGAVVAIPAEGLQGPAGAPPDGEIVLAIRFIDPARQPMPGEDGALGAKGEPLVLDTFGVLYTSARDGMGNPLTLKPGVVMTVVVPLTLDRVASAPSEVGLWRLDPTKSAWVPEMGPSGMPAMLQRKPTSFTCRDKQVDPCDILHCNNVSNQAWVGQASTFGFLNADVAFDKPACLRLEVGGTNQVCLRFEIPSGGSTKIKEHCYGQGSHALYNLPANMPIMVKTLMPGPNCSPDISTGKMANPGDVWGGTGMPESASVCKGSLAIPPNP